MLEIYNFDCMSTPCEIQLYTNSKNIADSCASDILYEVKRLEKKYNYYDNNSYLSLLNKRDENNLDLETKTLLQRAKQYYKKTNKVFDITNATIKNLSLCKTIKQYENEKSILSKYIGCEHFNIKKNKLYFTNEFTKIDLGGFVKEYSVDRAINIVKKYKINSALINFGGDIYALGLKPNKDKFEIAIKNPLNQNQNLFTIQIEDEALTTSASYERYYIIQNKKFSHIMNAKDKNILSSTVIASTCLEAGVYSTSFMCDINIKTINKKYLINNNLEVIN